MMLYLIYFIFLIKSVTYPITYDQFVIKVDDKYIGFKDKLTEDIEEATEFITVYEKEFRDQFRFFNKEKKLALEYLKEKKSIKFAEVNNHWNQRFSLGTISRNKFRIKQVDECLGLIDDETVALTECKKDKSQVFHALDKKLEKKQDFNQPFFKNLEKTDYIENQNRFLTIDKSTGNGEFDITTDDKAFVYFNRVGKYFTIETGDELLLTVDRTSDVKFSPKTEEDDQLFLFDPIDDVSAKILSVLDGRCLTVSDSNVLIKMSCKEDKNTDEEKIEDQIFHFVQKDQKEEKMYLLKLPVELGNAKFSKDRRFITDNQNGKDDLVLIFKEISTPERFLIETYPDRTYLKVSENTVELKSYSDSVFSILPFEDKLIIQKGKMCLAYNGSTNKLGMEKCVPGADLQLFEKIEFVEKVKKPVDKKKEFSSFLQKLPEEYLQCYSQIEDEIHFENYENSLNEFVFGKTKYNNNDQASINDKQKLGVRKSIKDPVLRLKIQNLDKKIADEKDFIKKAKLMSILEAELNKKEDDSLSKEMKTEEELKKKEEKSKCERARELKYHLDLHS